MNLNINHGPFSSATNISNVFVGTRSQYNSLSQKEKESYGIFNIIDDIDMSVYTSSGTLIAGSGISSISSIPYDDNCVTAGISSITSQLEEELEKQKEDNINSIEDLKAKLSEYEARIQKLESEVEILKSDNPNKFDNIRQGINSNLADFF